MPSLSGISRSQTPRRRKRVLEGRSTPACRHPPLPPSTRPWSAACGRRFGAGNHHLRLPTRSAVGGHHFCSARTRVVWARCASSRAMVRSIAARASSAVIRATARSIASQAAARSRAPTMRLEPFMRWAMRTRAGRMPHRHGRVECGKIGSGLGDEIQQDLRPVGGSCSNLIQLHKVDENTSLRHRRHRLARRAGAR